MVFQGSRTGRCAFGALRTALILVCCVVAQGHAAQGRWVSFGGVEDVEAPEVHVVAGDVERTVLAVEVPGVEVEDVVARGARFHRLALPECGTTVEVGSPELPLVHATIAVPFGSEPTVRVVDSSVGSYPGYRIYPFQEPTTDADGSRSFSYDAHLYGEDAYYPSSRVSLGGEGVWRDLSVVVVAVSPFRYNPVTGDLEVSSSLTVEVQHSAGRDARFLEVGRSGVSPAFEPLYRGQVVNYEAIGVRAEAAPAGVDDPGTQYLIITHPYFEMAIEPLAEWHQRRGLRTEVLSISTTSPTAVKNEIMNRYNSGELDYVLLVGDVTHMPASYWSGHLSDYWYACMGDPPDLYADLAVGRLSGSLSPQVENQVEKILCYAKSPPIDDWLTSVLLVAHPSGVSTKEYIRTQILAGHELTVDTAYGDQPTGYNAAVTAAIDEGRNLVNYKGPGSAAAWTNWSFIGESWTTGNVYALTNGDRTSIVFNAASCNHQIQYDCLGEAWLDHIDGAVASLGASDPPYTVPNHDFDKQLFRAIYDQGVWNVGYVMNYADAEVIALHGYYGQDLAKMYLWLGDPATEIWTAVPDPLDASHPGTVPLGPSSFTVSVSSNYSPAEGALVCASKGSEVHETGMTNFQGQVTFSIDVLTPGTMYVTATKHDYLPYEGEALVEDSPVTITLVPDQTVVHRGETLSLTAIVENTTGVPQTFDGWTMVELPSHNPWGPAAGPLTVTLPPYGTAQKVLAHPVPMTVPLGAYIYFGYVGTYPDTVWDEDSFVFQVLP